MVKWLCRVVDSVDKCGKLCRTAEKSVPRGTWVTMMGYSPTPFRQQKEDVGDCECSTWNYAAGFQMSRMRCSEDGRGREVLSPGGKRDKARSR